MKQLFYELNLPEFNDDDGNPIWVVRIKDAPAYYLLNDGSYNLDNLMVCADEVFHFDSLPEAHRHACEYYSDHNKPYPYFAEYKQAVGNDAQATGVPMVNDNDIHSQQMTFN